MVMIRTVCLMERQGERGEDREGLGGGGGREMRSRLYITRVYIGIPNWHSTSSRRVIFLMDYYKRSTLYVP